MKLRPAAAFAFAAIMIAGTVQAQSAGPFDVTLPNGYGAFAQQVQKTPSPTGEIVTTNWISKAPTGEAVVVTVSKMPAKILDPQKLIESTRASLLKSLGATLEAVEPRPGELTSARLLFHTSGAFFRARVTVEGDRLYQLLYVGRSAEQRSAPVVSALFVSFRIRS